MTTPIALRSPLATTSSPATEDARQAIVEFYSEATQDYRFWSPDNLNMHFGYGRLRHLFNREAMLEAMNAKVLDALAVTDREGARVVDLGCGTGATMRAGAHRTRRVRFIGVTLSPEHVRRARLMNAAHPAASRLDVVRANYVATPLADASFDGACAVESACHAPGADKAALVAEAARLLKPGARLVVADAFRTDRGRAFGPVLGAAYRAMCRSWALPGLAETHAFAEALAAHGFEDIHVEDVSWSVALSVMHVPFVSLAFFLACLRRGGRPVGWRLSNAMASLLTMVIGLARWRFSYCVVSAVRR